MPATARSLWFTFLVLALARTATAAATLQPGDIVVIDTGGKQVVRIDPASGLREQITSWDGDTGQRLKFPWGIAIDADRQILISDMNARAVFSIDPATGSTRVVSGRWRGEGRPFDGPHGIALDGQGGAYVTNTRWRGKNSAHFVFHVDLATGDRRIIAANEIGEGPDLHHLGDLVFEPGGALLITLRVRGAIFRVDPSSGTRQVVTSSEVGTGPALGKPFGIARLADGDVVITDRQNVHVMRIDTATGEREIVSSSEFGSGPPLEGPFGVGQADDHSLYVSDLMSASIFRIDLESGARTVIASETVGTGPEIIVPRNLAVVPGSPRSEAAPLPWVAAGGVALFAGVALLVLIRRRNPRTPQTPVGRSPA